MNTIHLTVREGRWVSDRPTTEPEGTHKVVADDDRPPRIGGMTEEDQGTTPEEIERWIASFEAAPVIVLTPDEQARWDEWQARRAAYEEAAAALENPREHVPG